MNTKKEQKAKCTIVIHPANLAAIRVETTRLDRSVSWILEQSWIRAAHMIRQIDGPPEPKAAKATEGKP